MFQSILRRGLRNSMENRKARRRAGHRLGLLCLEDRTVPSTVQGTVFNDVNGNGVQDLGETGLAGWTVFSEANPNDIIDAGDLTAITDANGNYFMDTSSMPSQGYYTNLDLQVGDGTGRWMDTTSQGTVVTEANAVRDYGVRFQPYGSVLPVGGETLVNANAAGGQGDGSVSADANGNYVVVWGSAGINYARVFNADGSPRTGDLVVSLGGSAQQVAMAGNGNFLVIWTDNSSAYARLYQPDGTPISGTITVAAGNSKTTVFAASVAADAASNFVVVNRVETTKSLLSVTRTVTAQRITSSGALNGSAITVANYGLINGETSVAMDGSGNFVVVWDDIVTTKVGRTTTSNSAVLAQRYTAAGVANGSRTTVVSGDTSGAGTVWKSTVAMNATGKFAVAWHNSNGPGLHSAKVFNADGTVAIGPLVVAPSSTMGVSRIAIDGAGNTTFAWTVSYAAGGADVWMARLLADGTLKAPIIVNTTTQGLQRTGGQMGDVLGGVAATGNGSFVVTWQGYGAADDSGIFSQRYGSPLLAASAPPASMPNVPLSNNSLKPLLTEALHRWQSAGVDVSGLGDLNVRVADLGGLTLGLASGHSIMLDDNAAGWGWFVDSTPNDDSEFLTPGNQGERNRMDLLTVLEHEIGHVLGCEHEESGVMVDTLPAGSRRLPRSDVSLSDFLQIDWLSVADLVLPAGQRKK